MNKYLKNCNFFIPKITKYYEMLQESNNITFPYIVEFSPIFQEVLRQKQRS